MPRRFDDQGREYTHIVGDLTLDGAFGFTAGANVRFFGGTIYLRNRTNNLWYELILDFENGINTLEVADDNTVF